ncbi:hypothetical protein BLNAU_19867 [Blattamonas nauphoetae]|uniref:Protein kinase domain-containing protein n=1 Tax=Blattamonas nauphoetae TaxID=2049346 RepID=A0ABQ9X0B4_9EUKA|nr:hypothetical protein BLNAU_19867 [Blattamonas nauphoetae]
MDEPARLVSISKVDGDNGTTLTLNSRALTPGSEYSIKVVGTPTATPESNEEHSSILTMTATSDTSNILSASLYPFPGDLLYGYTYSVEEMNRTNDSSPVLIEKSDHDFSTPAEPTRLVTFTKGQYDNEKKRIGFVMTGLVLEEGVTYKVVLSASATENHTIEMSFNTPSDQWEGSATLYPLTEAELVYGTTYTVSSFRKGADSTELIRDTVPDIPIMEEPARLVSISNVHDDNGTTLTLNSRALTPGSEYSIKVVGTPTATSGSNEEHSTTLKLTPSSATSNTLSVTLCPVRQLLYGYTYSVEEMNRTNDSSPVLIEKSACVFSTPKEPERLVSVSCASSCSDPQQSELLLTFSSCALLANTKYTITVLSTAVSSIPSHTKSITVTTENDGTITSFYHSLYPIEEEPKRGEQLEYGLMYTVQSFKRGSTSLNFDVETCSFTVPTAPPEIHSPSVHINTPSTGCVVSFKGTNLEMGKKYKVTLTTTLSFIITMESATNAISDEMSLQSADSLQFGTEYEVDTITPLNPIDRDVLFDKPLTFRLPDSMPSPRFYVDTETGTDTAFCGDETRPCKTMDEAWRIVAAFSFLHPSIFILKSSTLSSQMEVTGSMHVLVSNGWDTEPKLFVPSSTSVAEGAGLIMVTSGFIELRNVDVIVQNTSPTFVFLDGDSATIELRDGLFTVESSAAASHASNDNICSWTTGLIRLNSCEVDVLKTEFIHIPSGAIEMKKGFLKIRSSSFESNTPPSSPFTSIRRNIHCSEEGKIEIIGVTIGDGANGSSAWISTDTCSVTMGDVESNAPLFVPTLSPNSTSTLEKRKNEFNVVVLGTTLIPCGLSLEVFEMEKDDVEGNAVPIPLDPSSSTTFTDTNITLSIDRSSFSLLSDKHEWRGRLTFEKDQRTSTSFQIQASLSARRSESAKKNMKWWLPLVIILVCLSVLLIIVAVILWRRKQKKELPKNLEEMTIQPMDEEKVAVDEFNVNPSNSALAVSSSIQPIEKSHVEDTQLQQAGEMPNSTCVEVVVCENGNELSTAKETDTLYSALHSKDSTREVCKLSVQQQIARGLVSLAQVKPVVDIMTKLSSHWVFFDGLNRVCLKTRSDQKSMGENKQTQKSPQIADLKKGNLEFQRWMAPEIANQNSTQISAQGDHATVFSLGLVLWEIETGLVPFGEVDEQTAQRRLRLGEKPNMEKVSEEMQAIIDSCLNLDASQRPSLKTVSSLLDQLDSPPLPTDDHQNKLASKTN